MKEANEQQVKFFVKISILHQIQDLQRRYDCTNIAEETYQMEQTHLSWSSCISCIKLKL